MTNPVLEPPKFGPQRPSVYDLEKAYRKQQQLDERKLRTRFVLIFLFLVVSAVVVSFFFISNHCGTLTNTFTSNTTVPLTVEAILLDYPGSLTVVSDDSLADSIVISYTVRHTGSLVPLVVNVKESEVLPDVSADQLSLFLNNVSIGSLHTSQTNIESSQCFISTLFADESLCYVRFPGAQKRFTFKGDELILSSVTAGSIVTTETSFANVSLSSDWTGIIKLQGDKDERIQYEGSAASWNVRTNVRGEGSLGGLHPYSVDIEADNIVFITP
ncbi:hypothetical protein GEMRC1_011517 [Eukaryota sp. GEM-RC1]